MRRVSSKGMISLPLWAWVMGGLIVLPLIVVFILIVGGESRSWSEAKAFENHVGEREIIVSTTNVLPSIASESNAVSISLPFVSGKRGGNAPIGNTITLPSVPFRATKTPFQPQTLTPTPSFTPSPSRTPTATQTQTPTKPPPQTLTPTIPNKADITGIRGRYAAFSLDCESRSAVDWAAYFGVQIYELTFFQSLPISDNPEKGFVGSVYGAWGQIPPYPYGVHAKPVARLLREYGLNARADRHMTWDEIRIEISAGRPVIVWVVGHVARGTPVSYTASDGQTTTVTRFEHTVIVTGYTKHRVTVLDGHWVYEPELNDFLDSWGVLGNMAIILEE